MLVAGHPPTFVAVSFILCVVITSANSSTNPQAVCEKPVVEHSLGVDVFATLKICVPYVPRFTSFVLPTAYSLPSPSLIASIIVSQSSVEKFLGGVSSHFPSVILSVVRSLKLLNLPLIQ